MKKTIINTLIFAAGAAIGSAVTWKLAKSYYEKIVQDEIDSVREAFGCTIDHEIVEDSEACDVNKKVDPAITEYEEIVEDLGYKNNSDDEEEEGATSPMMDEPIIISPEEFGEIYDYGTVSLTYYADGVVVDDADNVLDTDEVEATIGLDSLEHFGEYEDDSVFVRNHDLKTDYEILKDLSNYYDDEPSNEED